MFLQMIGTALTIRRVLSHRGIILSHHPVSRVPLALVDRRQVRHGTPLGDWTNSGEFKIVQSCSKILSLYTHNIDMQQVYTHLII